MRSVIKIDKLSVSFGEEQILKDISCEFDEGLIYGIVGNNGSGKTVLMKCICGFLIPTSGVVEVNYKRIGKDVDFPENIGIIIETPGFLPNLTGMKNLELLADLRGMIGKDTIHEVLHTVGLDPNLKKPVAKYSLGMRQRLGIAQAIMEDPAILILDEPFNGLDKRGVAQMHELIQNLKSRNKTILLSSHSQHDIDTLCDVVYEMDAGVMKCIRNVCN
ncbi:MAG: ATP-binding cassette domain-containing protein [Clostridium sp.]|nr:ATP-binding cassette domain-containing protein [Clostridium sp.]